MDTLEVLIRAGADVNSINEEQSTPLFIAMQKDNPAGAAVLIDHGADIRHKNLRGISFFRQKCFFIFYEFPFSIYSFVT